MRQIQTSDEIRRKYTVYDHEIGSGGLGRVFLGEQIQKKTPVAVKISHKTHSQDPYTKILDSNQRMILQKLKGLPHILQYFDAFQFNDKQLLVTELCSQKTLLDILTPAGMGADDAAALFRQISLAYRGMYSKGVVHRDLKPANIFFDSKGSVKIGDFGLSTHSQDPLKEDKFSIGSKSYRAPETFTAHQYSFKSDIWALGVILFQVLTGKKPWAHSDKKQLHRLIKSQPIETIISNNMDYTFQTLLKRTLAISVEDRAGPEEFFELVACLDISSPIKKVRQKTSSTNRTNKIVKYLINIVDFCRFQYQLLKLIKTNSTDIPDSENLVKFIKGSINRLFEATRGEALACFSRSEVASYNNSPDSAKLRSAVQKYIIDYGLSAGGISNKETSDSCLNQALQWLSLNIKLSSSYQLFLLYDNLITLRWLYSLSLEQTLSNIKNVEISQLVRCLRGELKEKGKGIVNKELLQLHNKLVCLQEMRRTDSTLI